MTSDENLIGRCLWPVRPQLVQPAVSSRQADEAAAEAHRLRHRYPQHGLCSRCPPGFGVARRCTPVRDTVCRSCPPGYYAPGYSRKHSCWPCSRCGKLAPISLSLYLPTYLSIYPSPVARSTPADARRRRGINFSSRERGAARKRHSCYSKRADRERDLLYCRPRCALHRSAPGRRSDSFNCAALFRDPADAPTLIEIDSNGLARDARAPRTLVAALPLRPQSDGEPSGQRACLSLFTRTE